MAEPVKVGVVGAGYWGRNYVRNLAAMPEAELCWVCDADAAALQRSARVAPGAQLTGDISRLLEDPQLEAVVIATPAVDHHQHARAALVAGKHVLVEKPMTTAAAAALELVQLSERQRRVLMVGHLMVYHPAVERLRAMIQQGELGRIYYLYAVRVNLGRLRSDENALWSLAPHDVSVINYLLGCDPLAVSARGRAYLQPGIEDVVFLNLDYANQVLAQIQISWLDPHKERRLTVVGSRKMVVFDDTHATEKLRVYDKGYDRPPEYETFGDFLSLRDGDVHIPRIGLTEPLTAECTHFLHCIRSGQTPRSSGRDGLGVVSTLEAAARSIAMGGSPVSVEPGAEAQASELG